MITLVFIIIQFEEHHNYLQILLSCYYYSHHFLHILASILTNSVNFTVPVAMLQLSVAPEYPSYY